jgi:hypothetical protein
MHPAKQWHHETLARRTVEALKKNDFDAHYVPDPGEARETVLSMVPAGATIGFGTSMTLEALGIFGPLREGDYRPVNPPWDPTAQSPERRLPLRRQAATADVYLTGSNAVTLDGKLVNVDATGNRVAAMIFGPKKTIVVAGVNKIVHTVDEALDRITNWAGPQNARRLGYDTPCATTGVCNDCRSAGRICKATVILHRKTSGLDMSVILVGEQLGL